MNSTARKPTLSVLQNVLHPIANDDWIKQTPCREFDIAKLTDHLMNSIVVIGGAADASYPSVIPLIQWRAKSSPRQGPRWTRGIDAGSTAP